LTMRADATCAHTRVHTLVVDTCLLSGTVRVEHTLRSTADVWVAEGPRPADASHTPVVLMAVSIRPTPDTITGVGLVYDIWRWS